MCTITKETTSTTPRGTTRRAEVDFDLNEVDWSNKGMPTVPVQWAQISVVETATEKRIIIHAVRTGSWGHTTTHRNPRDTTLETAIMSALGW